MTIYNLRHARLLGHTLDTEPHAQMQVEAEEIELVCGCQAVYRNKDEPEREWFKRYMCMYHWMQTDYYRNKLNEEDDYSITQV